MLIKHYAGWKIYDNGPYAPVTGRFSAERFGVTMCANTQELLIRMIETRIKDERRYSTN